MQIEITNESNVKTKLNAISDGTMTKAELKKVLGKGNITAVISLVK